MDLNRFKINNLKINKAAIDDFLHNFLSRAPLFLAPFLPLAFLAGNVVTEITVAFTVVCYLLHLYVTRDFQFLRESWIQVLFVFIFYLFVRNVFLEHPLKSLTLILHLVEFIIFALALIYWVLVQDRGHQRLLLSLGLVLVFVIFDTYLQYFRGADLFGRVSDMAFRLTGPFEHKRVGAFIAFLVFPPLIVALDMMWKKYPSLFFKFIGFMLIGLVFLILLLSGERATLIYAAVGFGLMLFLWRGYHLTFLRVSLVASVTILVLFSSLVFVKFSKPEWLQPLKSTAIYESLKMRLFFNSTVMLQQGQDNQYIQIWKRGVHMFTHAPLFGVGVHQFKQLCPDALYGPTDNIQARCGEHLHHFYLEFLTETGIVGFSLIVTVFILLLIKIWSTRHRWDQVPLLFGLFIAYAISIWPLAPFRGFFQNWRAVMFWFIVGWMMAAIKCYTEKKHEKLHLHK